MNRTAPQVEAGSPIAPPRRRIVGVVAWAVVGLGLLAASSLARSIQDRRFEAEVSYSETCPFPLKTLPTTLGRWKLVEGQREGLDELTVRITGSNDHILRTYYDEMTGVTLSALVLFGPAAPVVPHTPEICYPSSGFHQVEEASVRSIPLGDGKVAPFRSMVYAKAGGRSMAREEVYYSFRLGNEWSPDMGRGRKFPRKNPGIFKVQVQRRVVEGERRDQDDPIEQFLPILVNAIESELKARAGAAAVPEVAGR